MNIIRRFLSTSTENSNYIVSSRLLNRNPRTLEWQNLQWRSTGWPLQYPSKDYLHRVRLLSSGRHLTAQIDHYYTGNICVQVSTREWAVRKHLATCKDRSVAYNLAIILAQRAEECGITKIHFGHPHDKRYENSSRLQYFYRGLVDSNIEFEQPSGQQVQLTRDSIDGVNYDEHERDVRYAPPNIRYPPDLYQDKLHFFQLGLNKNSDQFKNDETREVLMLNRLFSNRFSFSISTLRQSLRGLSLTAIQHKRSHADIREGAVREINLHPENIQAPLSFDVDKYYGGIGQVRETDFERLIGDANNPEALQVKYEDLPIVHMKCTRNNTIIDVSDCTGVQIFRTSCGVVGFHNAKKGTTTAAQAVGMHMGNNLLRRNIKHVRVVVKGTGPGRLMAIKGLQLAGVDVVTITDNTSIPTLHVGLQRPKKMRRV